MITPCLKYHSLLATEEILSFLLHNPFELLASSHCEVVKIDLQLHHLYLHVGYLSGTEIVLLNAGHIHIFDLLIELLLLHLEDILVIPLHIVTPLRESSSLP